MLGNTAMLNCSYIVQSKKCNLETPMDKWLQGALEQKAA